MTLWQWLEENPTYKYLAASLVAAAIFSAPLIIWVALVCSGLLIAAMMKAMGS